MARQFADIHSIVGAVAQDYQYKKIFTMPPGLVKIWLRVWRFIHHWIDVFLSWLGKSLEKSGSVGKAAAIGLTVFLFVGLSVLVYWQYKRWKINHWKANTGTVGGEEINQLLTAIQWRQRALLLKEEGNFADACRTLHRACLQLLDEAHILVFAPARSNYEYVMALSARSALRSLRPVFQSFSNLVDGIYFGNRPASEADFQFCLKSLEEVEEKLSGIASGALPDQK